MTFLEILKSPITNLPLHAVKGVGFRKALRQKLAEFGSLVEESPHLSGPVNGIEFKPEHFKKKNRILREGILKSVDAYYEGKPHVAYLRLSETMKAGVKGYLDKHGSLGINKSLFRIRTLNSNFPLTSKDLFHIPFEKRGIVKTQRYSIPGLPSLYLSNCIYVAWEELLRPNQSSVQAIRLTNTKQIRLLDLTTDLYNDSSHITNNEGYGWHLLYKVMTWPLVAACSFKVYDRENPFKPEYIIPQLLTQWINMDSIDGIKYSSTHVDKRRVSGHVYNIVLPVRTFEKDKGLCPELKSMFRCTDVIPMELSHFATIANRFHDQASINAEVNPEVSELELILGANQPYAHTSFGKLEHLLNHLSTKRL